MEDVFWLVVYSLCDCVYFVFGVMIKKVVVFWEVGEVECGCVLVCDCDGVWFLVVGVDCVVVFFWEDFDK